MPAPKKTPAKKTPAKKVVAERATEPLRIAGTGTAASTVQPRLATALTTAQRKALDKFEAEFTKSFGAGTLMREVEPTKYDVIPTGSLALDMATSVGGYVRGRLHEIWGVDAIGKTTMSLIACAEAQRLYPDRVTMFVDMEQTFDWAWAIDHGIDKSRMLLHVPSTAEGVADAIKKSCSSDLFSLVVLDSVASMIPKREREKMAEEEVVGTQAKIITRMVKVNAVEARRTNTAVIFLNQVRANIGNSYVDKTTGGGWALKHGTTIKMQFSRGPQTYKAGSKDDALIVGHDVAVKIERNKVGPSQRRANFAMFFQPSEKYGAIGVDKADEAARLGVKMGIIDQRGGYYDLPNGTTILGLDRVVDHYREHPEEVEEVRALILAAVVGTVKDDAAEPAIGDDE